MDHYKVLGVPRNASKEEIKQAFRKLAMQFHPDKHSESPKHVKDTSMVKFKQVSEAYEILMDDGKRADYNIDRSSSSRSNDYKRSRQRGYEGRQGNGYSGYGTGYGYSGAAKKSAATDFPFERLFSYFATRAFARDATFAGALIAGVYFINAGGVALWNMINSGKSFEDAMGSIEQVKAVKDKL